MRRASHRHEGRWGAYRCCWTTEKRSWPNVGSLSFLETTGQYTVVRSFGRRQAYENPRGRNPRGTVDGSGSRTAANVGDDATAVGVRGDGYGAAASLCSARASRPRTDARCDHVGGDIDGARARACCRKRVNRPFNCGIRSSLFCPCRGHGLFRGHGLMIMCGSEASTCAARSLVRSRLSEVTTSTVRAGHHRSGFSPAISS